MFSEFQDYGLILVFLAAFGFIISDAFKIGRYWGIPDLYRSNIEKIFHYISNAIISFVVFFFIFLLVLIKYSKDPSIIFITSYFQKLGITEESYIMLFFLSIFIMFVYGSAFYLGLFFRYMKAIWVNVFISGEERMPRKFSSLITESKDFFFFEKENSLLWEAIRKDQIIRMETIMSPSKFQIDLSNYLNKRKLAYLYELATLKNNVSIVAHKLQSLLKELSAYLKKLSRL